MKKLTYFLFLLLFGYTCFGQAERKLNLSLQKKLNTERQTDPEISVFVKGDIATIQSKTEELGGVFKYAAGNIAAIRIRLSKITEIASSGSVIRVEDNDLKLQPLNDQMVVNNKVQVVQTGFNLPQGYDGSGVVIGIIDEGIDFTHPDFRDEYNRTRIKYVWDQSILNIDPSTQAHPYGYGKEYAGNQIDTSTQHHDSPFSHGSHVAGIACGNGLALNNYKGVAPKSDIIVVKMNLYQSDNSFLSNLVDAVHYIFDRADQLGEPAVINISLGTYFGSHDGKDIQAESIDNLITAHSGRVVVCSAGNAGNAPIHLGYDASSDTNFTWLQFSSQVIHIQAWGDSSDFAATQFSMGIDRVKPDYKSLGNLPFTNIASYQGFYQSDTIYQGSQRLGIIESLGQSWNGTSSIDYYIYPDSVLNINGSDTSRYYWRFMNVGRGRLDAWSLDMVFDNLPDSATYPSIKKYKIPDTDQTIVSSFTCSDKVITVGSYTNRNTYTNVSHSQTQNSNLTVGQLSVFSSHGPTRDGRTKPDITATGEWVLSCGTQSELNILTAVQPDMVAAGGKHKRSSGTSMSSPVVAGIAALYLQKNPTADWQEVKNALLSCADRDTFTGFSLPNNLWGIGKVNAYSSVKGCSVGFENVTGFGNIEFRNFPNPATSVTFLHYDLSMVNIHVAEIHITDMLGDLVKTIHLNDKKNTLDISTSGWCSGIYFCSLLLDGKVTRTLKLVVL